MGYVQRGLCGLLWAMLTLALAGCDMGEKLVTVTGRIVEGGQPLAVAESEYRTGGGVEVRFVPLDDAGQFARGGTSFATSTQPDGTFVMDGDVGDGIPAGRYRVVLSRRGAGSYSPDAQSQGDMYAGKFDLENSPFTFDLQSDQEIVLDLSTAGGAGASESESAEPENAESEESET